jgi:hypothetical protein
LREIAGRMGCEIVKVYKDHGISGTRGRDKRAVSRRTKSLWDSVDATAPSGAPPVTVPSYAQWIPIPYLLHLLQTNTGPPKLPLFRTIQSPRTRPPLGGRLRMR